MNVLLKLARSPSGRVVSVLVGFIILGISFKSVSQDPSAVLSILTRGMTWFPLIAILEVCILACSVAALRLLYGKDRSRLPVRALVRAGLVGYAVMGLVPAGRTAAESVRAIMLTEYSSAARAAAAATRLQGIALLANCFISIPASMAMFYALGVQLPTVLIILNGILTGVMGWGVLLASSRMGRWLGSSLGRRAPRIQKFAQEFDQILPTQGDQEWFPAGALAWEFFGRILQVIQNGILVLAVGGHSNSIVALCSEAIHLVGAAAGDLIPAQLGATEFNYQWSAHALSLSPSDALSIALLAHLAQGVWVVVGLLVPMFWSTAPRPKAIFSEPAL